MAQHQHDCEKMISKVFLSLDGELTEKEEQFFLEEIKICPSCLEKFKIERSFKYFLISKIRKKCYKNDLASEIRDKLKKKAN